MRRTRGLLLTMALLLSAVARAQPGLAGPYEPFGPQPGAPGGLGAPYTPVLPPGPPAWAPRPAGPRSPWLRYGPGAGEPYIPGVPSIRGPFERPVWKQLPPGADDPLNPTALFRDPTWWDSLHDKVVPAAPNVPPITPLPIDPKVLDDYKRSVTPPPTPSPPGGCGNWAWILGAIAAGIGAAARGLRRSSDERK